MLSYLKAYVAAGTAFIGFAVAKGISLDWRVEGALLATFAAAAVFLTPNKEA